MHASCSSHAFAAKFGPITAPPREGAVDIDIVTWKEIRAVFTKLIWPKVVRNGLGCGFGGVPLVVW